MEKIDLMQLALDQITDLYANNTQLSTEDRKKLQAEFEKIMEELSHYNNESRKERDKRRQESKPTQPKSSLDKLAAELKEVKEQLVSIQSEGIEDTSHFDLPARVRRLEQLLATNVQDINTCWERLKELEHEIGRLK
ncbi:hypothetical protein [Paenibacillus odorifer]|uniref:hypothetical protein n=1 Tax=Paenibacillus odorifer TaxID=189426 RepID=UPI00289E8DFC|nr:hypothetical protein [Paenibacillus odorifer]